MRGDSTVISQDRVGEADVTSDPRISVADNKGWFLARQGSCGSAQSPGRENS